MRAIVVHGLLRIPVSVIFAIAAFSLCLSAKAQTVAATAYCWIDAATGQPVATVPIGITREELFSLQVGDHPNQAHGAGAHDYVKQPDGTWIDAATGQPVATVPIGITREELYSLQVGDHPNQAHGAGAHDYVRVPCPPPPAAPATQTSWTGGYLGGELAKNWGAVKTTEKLAATDVITNQFTDSGDPIGGGVNAGWLWQLPSDIVVGPVFDAYFPSATVSHQFAGGAYLRSTVDFTATFQARAGYLATPDLLLYAQTGLAVGTQSLKINFGGPISSKSDTTVGPTIGAGVEWRLFDGPTGLIGQSPSLFVEYTHIWWDDAHFNTPSASPGFNYAWSRESDEVKAGFRVRF